MRWILLTLTTSVISITPMFSQVAHEMHTKGINKLVWLIILIIAAVIGAMIFLSKRGQKNYIEKLTSEHFANGENFDKEAFTSLVGTLRKSRRNAWKVPVVWLVGMLLATLFAGMGGALGYFLAVACIFAGIIGGNLSVLGEAKRIKAAKEELGITQKDINVAIKQIKRESQKNVSSETTVSAKPAQKL